MPRRTRGGHTGTSVRSVLHVRLMINPLTMLAFLPCDASVPVCCVRTAFDHSLRTYYLVVPSIPDRNRSIDRTNERQLGHPHITLSMYLYLLYYNVDNLSLLIFYMNTELRKINIK